MNEAVVSQPSGAMADVVGSDVKPAAEHCKPKNAQTDTVNSDTQPVEPREHRRPHRAGIIWAAGSKLEARDFLNKWYIKHHPD